jgi:hypothetical protein
MCSPRNSVQKAQRPTLNPKFPIPARALHFSPRSLPKVAAATVSRSGDCDRRRRLFLPPSSGGDSCPQAAALTCCCSGGASPDGGGGYRFSWLPVAAAATASPTTNDDHSSPSPPPSPRPRAATCPSRSNIQARKLSLI